MTIGDYDPNVRNIVIAHSTSLGEVKITGAVVRIGHRPGVCAEVFSLSRSDSNTTGLRTCLIHIHSPNVHDFFNKWKVEWTKIISDSEDLNNPEYHYKMMDNKRTHLIALKIPVVPTHLKVYAVGKQSTMQAIGELTLPHADGKAL